MKLYFKPMPGLTIATIISLAILISLGTWQYQRLQWKTDLLTEIDAAATSAPGTSIHEVQDLLAQEKPVDFRRIEFAAKPIAINTPFHVYQVRNQQTVWRPFIPVSSGGTQIFVALPDVIADTEKSAAFVYPADDMTVTGYVRLFRPQGRFTTQSSPNKNRWFGFNPMPETHDWADQVSGEVDTRFYIDAVETDASGDLPVKRPDIRNNHLDYMLTWYSFAIILLVIYFILHRRAGRLGYKRT